MRLFNLLHEKLFWNGIYSRFIKPFLKKRFGFFGSSQISGFLIIKKTPALLSNFWRGFTKRSYGAAPVWEDADAKRCGSTTDKYSTKAGFDAGVTVLMGSAPFATAHTGTLIHDPELHIFLATIRCHDANSEIYSVTICREMITVASTRTMRSSQRSKLGRTAIRRSPDPAPAEIEKGEKRPLQAGS